MSKPNSILYVTCYLDNSGVTEINRQILAACQQSGIKVHVFTTDVLPANSANRQKAFEVLATTITIADNDERRSVKKAFIDLIKASKIDVIFICHSRWAYENIHIIKTAAPFSRIIDSLHTLEPFRLYGGFPDLSACKLVNPFLDGTIAISEHLIGYLSKYYDIPLEKLHFIPNGISLEKFHTVALQRRMFSAHNLEHQERRVGFIGRIVSQKDPILFVDVANRMLRSATNLKFIIVGTGPLLPKMKSAVNRIGLDESFLWYGDCLHIEKVLSTLDLLLISSKYEGVPLVAIESLAAGVPVVSTDVGAIREQLGEFVVLEKTGPRLAGRLAATSSSVLANGGPIYQFSDLKRFDIQRTAAKYISVFSNNPIPNGA